MKNKVFVIALSIVLGPVCFTTSALAQSTFGTILGTVTDASGAVVPNITVKLTNQGENISREVQSDSQGTYQAENLKEGIYTVTVQAQGFREVTVKDVRLTARQIVRTDLKLVVGATTENVTVEANAELINTESEAISTSIGSTEVLGLPAITAGRAAQARITCWLFSLVSPATNITISLSKERASIKSNTRLTALIHRVCAIRALK